MAGKKSAGKKHGKRANVDKKSRAVGKAGKSKRGAAADPREVSTAGQPLSRKEYERELKKLHVELVKLQEWVKLKGLKVCILFEGRDAAGARSAWGELETVIV